MHQQTRKDREIKRKSIVASPRRAECVERQTHHHRRRQHYRLDNNLIWRAESWFEEKSFLKEKKKKKNIKIKKKNLAKC